jgi:hypothetical protein
MSSPQINNLIIAGCILSYTSVLLMGIDSTLLGKRSSESAMNFICAVRFLVYIEILYKIYLKGTYMDIIYWFYDIVWSNI